MKQCCKIGCMNEGTLIPVLSMRSQPGTTPAHMEVGMAVCEDCSRTMRPDEILTPESWEMICRTFRDQNKVRPSRSLNFLIFRPIESAKIPVKGGNDDVQDYRC